VLTTAVVNALKKGVSVSLSSSDFPSPLSSPSRLVQGLFGHHGHTDTRVFRGTSMPMINTRQTKRSLPKI
jgi:hypothetical protein